MTKSVGVEPQKHIFSNKQLLMLLLPIIAEQLLNSLMGTVDSIMVSNVGSEAISAVSLVDSINMLVIQAFAALSTGGVIICANFVGQGNKEKAEDYARQLSLVALFLSSAIAVSCMVFSSNLLGMIFGTVDALVMNDAKVYFFFTIISFPFIALYSSGSAIYRAQGITRLPMVISIISNFINIFGNAWLIWGVGLGVEGAAIATLASRVFSAVLIYIFLHRKNQIVSVRNYLSIRPEWKKIKSILLLGIPNGIENSMFQFGKLAIQSTVSTLGTAAMAAQAMTNILESVNGIAGIGIGIGLMTIVGQCIGAGRKDEAIYYVKKMIIWGEIAIIISCALVYALTGPVTVLGGMTSESASLCMYMMGWITVIKPIVWTMSFVPAYGMRAAGDVKFSMITSTVTMWLLRVSLCMILCRFFGFGPIAVWIGMFTDWTARSIIFTIRFKSGKWLEHKII